MRLRHRLRTRILLAFLLFGLALSAMLGGTIWVMRQYLENQLLGVRLQQELESHIDNLRKNPRQANQPFSGVRGWFVAPGKTRSLPPAFHNLDNGIHYLESDGKPVMVVVHKDPDIWGYLQYDISWNKHIERLTLAVIVLAVVFFGFISLMLAVMSSRRIMAPVTDLVDRIHRMSNREDPEPLRPHFPDDEVGQLAAAFDQYAERLTALVRRDREFNADVSHELRTPLAVIRSATELLMNQPDLSPKTRTRLERIQRAVRQSTDLTTALLHLVRGQKADRQTGIQHDIVPLVEQVVEDHKPQLVRKPVDVAVEVHNPFRVHADAASITVALGNLIGNAFKYTAEGQVRIVVDAPCVLVADSGPGLPEEELDKVFDRYYRARGSSGTGSGIGLAIVQRLCDLHGWQISLQTGEPRGLVARICFQRDPED